MTKPNTNYGLRNVSDTEIVRAFGSLAACLRITGGDLPTILYYLNNADRIDWLADISPQSGEFAEQFRERANAEAAGEAFDRMEKPTIAAVSRSMGVCRQVARRALVTAGKLGA